MTLVRKIVVLHWVESTMSYEARCEKCGELLAFMTWEAEHYLAEHFSRIGAVVHDCKEEN